MSHLSFDPHVGTGLYDDILGLMRRYDLKPTITQEVGEAMTIIGLVAAGWAFRSCPLPLNGCNCMKCVDPDSRGRCRLRNVVSLA